MRNQEIQVDALDVLAILKMRDNNVAASSINSGYLIDNIGNLHRVVKCTGDNGPPCLQCSCWGYDCPTGVLANGKCILEKGFVFVQMS
jgi:hypothetical protein